MAEQVARLKILAQIEGLEGFDKLKGAFKGLQSAIGPSDAALSKARKEILAFGEAGAKSEAVIRGQIDALKALQGQATIGGAAYRQLGKDVRALGTAYAQAKEQAKDFSEAQLRNLASSDKPSIFSRQIGFLKADLAQLKLLSTEYLDLAAQISRREIRFNAKSGRSAVIANNQALEDPNYPDPLRGMRDMPDTTAALNQRLRELNDRFQNLTRGGEQWISTSQEIARVQRELNREFKSDGVRAAEERLRRSRGVNSRSGFLAFSQGAEERIAEQARADRERRQTIYSAPIGPAAPTELMRSVNAAFGTAAANQAQLMGRSYSEVAASIQRATAASDGSINSLRTQRAAWEALRNTVGDNKVAFRDISKEINKVDRQLEKRGVGGGGIGQRAQALGAVASGAIFGGPEGAIGGLIGMAAGGVGGAFAGAAIGGSVSVLRQQIAATAEYAASVGRLKIALKELTGTSEEYAETQRIVQSISKGLNVPVLETTKGFTQLLASIKGAGGGVADAEVVFRGVSEAIKATGGSAEDVQGAITAMSQVFSKGKVSAEELQGQLGERLPGAVTLFAQATGRTLPQLQKDLEQGVVSLNDLMKFSVALSNKYGESARTMASSQEDATARMRVAIDDLREAFGSAVMPITTSITSIITKLAELATRALKAMGLVKQALGEMGAAERDSDLSQRLKDANQPLGLKSFGPFQRKGLTPAELTEFRRGALALEKAITPQTNKAGLEQNLRYLKEVQQLLRRVPADTLTSKQIDAFEVDQKRIQGRINETTSALDSLKQAQDKVGKGLTNFEAPKGKDEGRAEKEAAKDAELAQQLADREQRLNEATAQAEIRLAESVFRAAVDFDRKRFDLQQELIEKERQLRIAALTGVAAETASSTAQFFRSIDDLRRRTIEAAQQLAGAQQGVANAQRMQSVTGDGGGGGGGGVNGKIIEYLTGDRSSSGYRADHGGSNYHEHVAFETAEQMRKAMEALQKAGIKIGSTTGGRHAAGSYHYSGQAFDVPASQVPVGQEQELSRRVRQVLADAGFFGRGIGNGSGAAAQAATVRRNMADQGDTAVAQVDYQAAKDYSGLLAEMTQKRLPQEVQLYALEGTKAYREQTQAIKDSVGELEKKQELELSGARQEIIDGELQKYRATQQYTRQVEELRWQLEQKEVKEDPVKADGIKSRIEAITQAYNSQAVAIDQVTQAQIRSNDAQRFGQNTNIGAGLKQGAENYVQSIGTMKEATAQLTMNGIKGLEDALFNLATTGKTNFREFAADMLKQTARMIIQQMILRVLLQAVGAIGGGLGGGGGGITGDIGSVNFNPNAFSMPSLLSANGNAFAQNGIVPYAKGGVVNSPTLFKFAKGGSMATGLMGEAGPEAILPLKRGPNGKLGVQLFADGGVIDRRRDEDRLFRRGMRMNPKGSGVAGGRVSNGADKTSRFADFVENPYKLIRATGGDGLAKTKWGQSLGNYFNKAAADFASIPASSSLGAIGKYSANIFSQVAAGVSGGEPTKYAKGGVVNSPTLFKFANGGTMQSGLMGEAGPEAIMPLRRGRDGKLGVAGGGSGPVVVNVSVDASGSSVQGDAGRGDQLGQAMAQAVQAELIRQKRPGGLLAA